MTDTDGSETLALSVSSIPVGATLTDGVRTFTATAGVTSVDITSWTLANLKVTPPLNFNGNLQLTINATSTDTATLSTGVTSRTATTTQTINITVTGVNDAPIANADLRTTNENTPLVIAASSLTANDTDADGDVLTVTSVSNASHGTVSLVNGNITFTPTANFSGAATFNYTISDGHGGTSTATATIDVTPSASNPPVPAGTTALTGTSSDDILVGTASNDTLTGSGGNDVYMIARGGGEDQIINGVAGNAGPSGELDFAANISTDQLWFQQNGNDLSISILGTQDRITIDGWYNASTSQLQVIKTTNGLEIDSGLSQLVQAMATYSAANPGFDPATITQTPNDSGLQNAVAAAWHH